MLTKLLSNSLFPSVFYTVMYVLTSIVFLPVLIKWLHVLIRSYNPSISKYNSYEVRNAGGPRPIDLLYFSFCFNAGQHEEELNRGQTCNFYPKL